MTEPKAALDELREISSQIESAVLFDEKGKVLAATLRDDRAEWVASAARMLFEAAAKAGQGEPTQLEAATGEGSLFVVRDGEMLIAAATLPDPTAGLVFYDLKSCLRSAAAKAKPKPKPKARAKAKPKPKTEAKDNGKT